jgi:hypothetical protein
MGFPALSGWAVLLDSPIARFAAKKNSAKEFTIDD